MKTIISKRRTSIILLFVSGAFLFTSVLYAKVSNVARGVQPIWCYKSVVSEPGSIHTHITYCGTCSPVLATDWSGQTSCSNQG